MMIQSIFGVNNDPHGAYIDIYMHMTIYYPYPMSAIIEYTDSEYTEYTDTEEC
jgi:hypothetical protein